MAQRHTQLIALAALAPLLLLQGCASFDGRMVNAQGEQVDCSSMGGGLGLGALIGAGIAIADNQLCERSQRERGFVLQDDIGRSGIELPADPAAAPRILAATAPAAPCVVRGDLIARVDASQPANTAEARSALFGERGRSLVVGLRRADIDVQCAFELE